LIKKNIFYDCFCLY